MSLPAEALLFMASRAQLVAEIIRPALEPGKVVVCDRFLLANVVYQGHAGGLDPALLWQVGDLPPGPGARPDLRPRPAAGGSAAQHAKPQPTAWKAAHARRITSSVRQGFLAEARAPTR